MQVYDVTPFMEDHPGGDEVLLAATGNLIFPQPGCIVIRSHEIQRSVLEVISTLQVKTQPMTSRMLGTAMELAR